MNGDLPQAESLGPRPSGLIQGRLEDSFFEPLPPDELARWYDSEPEISKPA